MICVIGHKSPDTDSVASAIAYAALKNRLGESCFPAVAGKISSETRFALEHFGVPEPELLENVAGKSVILVDHREYSQAADGMEQATVVDLIDHHTKGDIAAPNAVIRELGATASLVYEEYLRNGVLPDRATAGILLSAVLSDTRGLRALTTTDSDRVAVRELALYAGIGDAAAFYETLREKAESYSGMTDEEIFFSDYKTYAMSGHSVGIASVRASAGRWDELMKRMRSHLQTLCRDDLYVLIHDEHEGNSALLYSGKSASACVRAAYGEHPAGCVLFTLVISRKRDIVPTLEAAYAGKAS